MKFVAVGAGILLLAVVLIGAGNAHGPVTELGTITLSPINGSNISGTASIAHGSQAYFFVRATNLASSATYGFAMMTAQCQQVRQMLNPIAADIAGDGTASSQMSGENDGWWLGILASNDATALVVACGPTTTNSGGESSAPTGPTQTPPTGGSTVVPVTTPTRVPTQSPDNPPHPPGS
jgi:hypothetical protein